MKISPSAGIRFPDRPAHSESLYRLSYSGLFFLKRIKANYLMLLARFRFESQYYSLSLLNFGGQSGVILGNTDIPQQTKHVRNIKLICGKE